jgi:hypothetical protein
MRSRGEGVHERQHRIDPTALDCGKSSFEVDQIVHSDGLDDHAQLGCRVLRFTGAEHHA